jgi:hypothetical protein
MKFSEVKQYVFDSELAKRSDVRIAMQLHHEYVSKYSARTGDGKPAAAFYEVDRAAENVDPLWHTPRGGQVTFSRIIHLAAINQFEKPDWRLKAQGLTPQRVDRFWVSRTALVDADYFPVRGDYVAWNGYRYGVLELSIPPESYWAQTNVWLGAVVRAVIIPEGDSPPVPANVVLPAELSRNA